MLAHMTDTTHIDVIDLADGTAYLHVNLELSDVESGGLTLDELGEAHRQLLAALEALRPALHRRLIEERARGGRAATWQNLQARSGYASITSVRLAVLSDLRERERAGERRRRALTPKAS